MLKPKLRMGDLRPKCSAPGGGKTSMLISSSG